MQGTQLEIFNVLLIKIGVKFALKVLYVVHSRGENQPSTFMFFLPSVDVVIFEKLNYDLSLVLLCVRLWYLFRVDFVLARFHSVDRNFKLVFEERFVDIGRRDNHFELLIFLARLFEKTYQYITTDVALVGFVDDDKGLFFQIKVFAKLFQHHGL